ncbi:MOSC domain-containing protein [Williamsia serinedens]|uniref:MOSC domain-containing protein YiiM n=1 Tax=Williamsia serinedens TaxID=391736 RepID=A0ABT1H173_9NOCA|nr:MOSC domain-containing protein [Williamsia serinedens]MCP2160995.1 MOSC domain-containing protein YiiM [Williamsia serinedens]
MTGRVLAVCAADRPVHLDRIGDSGIGKTEIPGSVRVTAEGIDGDTIVDTKHHGGRDQAVYAYSDAEARRWADELGRSLPYGWFGENLRVDGIDVTDAVIGEHWHIGDEVHLEVTYFRTPCKTFSVWAEEPRWIPRFFDRADVGAYLRVHREGTITAGDPITVSDRPDHGITVRALLTGDVDDDGLELLVTDPRYDGKVAREARKIANRRART